ncbi:cobalamin-dependent protein [Streptomyces sp. NPDC047108]|uniref:cobalamin B12-binding domain-containing protein n=1 Tax=Streptomyces sp. NPDC047108 TaxID=3155025 RepID=UPI0033FB03B1
MTTHPAPQRDPHPEGDATDPEGFRPGARLLSPPHIDAAAQPWADRLWAAIGAQDEYAALEVVESALAAGLAPESVLLDVIGTVQHRVGIEWAANRMTVADEHAATAISERAVSALPRPPRPDVAAAERTRVTVACVDGEWHALPARLLAETLRLRGFHVDYLGAHVPSPHLIAHLHRTAPAAVALSSSLPPRLPTAHAAITACQAAGVPVIAGGAAFGPDGRYARLLGADAWASDARAAADRLAEGLHRPSVGHQVADDLPHLKDQEYTMVARSRVRLVRETLQGLQDRFPAMRDYDDAQRDRTAEDLAHIADFLAVALYVDDPTLFTGFLTWTADVLTARKVPARSLVPTLELLQEHLHDFPRASALLADGRSALATC